MFSVAAMPGMYYSGMDTGWRGGDGMGWDGMEWDGSGAEMF
jgi:hypothetical protein